MKLYIQDQSGIQLIKLTGKMDFPDRKQMSDCNVANEFYKGKY